MLTAKMDIGVGRVGVVTSDNGGHSPEQVAELCVAKILSVSDQAHPALREQAQAFRQQLLSVVAHYVRMGAQQDRATVCAKLRDAGFGDLADQIRRL